MKLLCLRIKARRIPDETIILLLLTFDKQAGQSQSLVPTAGKTSRETNPKAFPLIYILVFFNCFDKRKMNDRNRKFDTIYTGKPNERWTRYKECRPFR